MKTSRGTSRQAQRPRAPPGPGDWIGPKYRLKELRGTGGMGTVWVAHNTLLDIDVALKLMRVDPVRGNPQRLVRRLLREARATARLEHPAIVRIFDFGLAEGGAPYIVMELLHGETLAEKIAREPKMEATKAVQLLLPIADALATAHGRGIIHRDIKPENLFLAKDEYGRLQPKIVDFGVARFLDSGRTLTRAGALMGTPDYMAPEQARGEEGIDECVDIWALCVVLYELIAGFRPFGHRNTNYLAVLRGIVHDAPNPKIRGIIDDRLWLILERGLRKKPRARWDTMRVLGEALALWLYEQGVREDILGSSIKAAWLQSGLGGVKIETASMLPDPIRPDPPRDAEESVIRPSPRVEPGDGLDSDRATVDEVAPDTKETAASVPDTQSESVPDSRRGSLNPLARQAQELRRLVLASIGVTALLALAVVVLLWDQHRTTRAVTTPTAALPPASVVSVPAPKPFAAPTASTHSVPEASADPSRLEEADAGTSETSAPSAPRPVSRPAPRRRHGRTKERNPEYELGF